MATRQPPRPRATVPSALPGGGPAHPPPAPSPGRVPMRRAVLGLLATSLLGSWTLTIGLALHLGVGPFAPARAQAPAPAPPAPSPRPASPPVPTSGQRAAAPTGAEGEWQVGPPGPWGVLETLAVLIDEPGGFLDPRMCDYPPTPWILPGFTPARVRALLDAAPLTVDQRQQLADLTACRPEPAQCRLAPEAPLLDSLSPAARSVLYGELADHPENSPKVNAFRWPPGKFERWLSSAGLQPASQALLRRLLWQRGGFDQFSDLELLCAALPSDSERLRTFAALSRSPALLVRLRVPHGADVAALADYWGADRHAEIEPLLAALAALPAGGTTDILQLLPPFPRSRLNTYASPADPPQSCFYSALNFARPLPDPRFVELAKVEQELAAHYTRQPAGVRPRLGDVILLANAEGRPLHAVVHIAEDIVFTKNGKTFHRPWVLQRFTDVASRYLGAKDWRVYRPQPR